MKFVSRAILYIQILSSCNEIRCPPPPSPLPAPHLTIKSIYVYTRRKKHRLKTKLAKIKLNSPSLENDRMIYLGEKIVISGRDNNGGWKIESREIFIVWLGPVAGEKKEKFEKIGRERWIGERGKRERNCNDIARNTQHLFHFRTSLAPLSPPPPSSSARKTGNLYFEAIKRECPWIHTYGPSVSKLITVPRQVRLVSLSKKFTPFPSFVLGDCGSGSIEPFDSKRVNACRHSVSVSIEARRNDLVEENRCPKKKYIYITRHRHR